MHREQSKENNHTHTPRLGIKSMPRNQQKLCMRKQHALKRRKEVPTRLSQDNKQEEKTKLCNRNSHLHAMLSNKGPR